ncbi:MAG: ATP-binding cassette domain-containing protein [Peptococcaceae bacterium]|nr:ATP-binding cassette domain-containing protein [Peptococcaceae bacterium]
MNRTLLRLSRGLWPRIFLIVAVKLVVLVGTARFAGNVAELLGDFLEPRLTGGQFRQAVLAAFLAAAVVLLGEVLAGEAEFLCAAKARRSLREKLFSRLLALDAVGADSLGVTAAVTATADGVEALQTYYSRYLPALFYSLTAPVYLFFALRDISLPGAALLLATAYCVTPLNSLFRQKVERLKKGYWNGFQQLTAYYLESLRGLTTVKLFNQDETRGNALAAKAENFNSRIMDMMRLNFSAFLFTDTLVHLAEAAALILVCVQAGRGAISLPAALMVFMLAHSFFASVGQLMSATHQAIAGVAASEQAAVILGEAPDEAPPRAAAPEPAGPRRAEAAAPAGAAVAAGSQRPEPVATDAPAAPAAPAAPVAPAAPPPGGARKGGAFAGIEIRGVSYRYGDRRAALRQVNLQIPQGSKVALVGQSGCGKSTLAALLMGFLTPAGGEIFIDGADSAGLAPERRRGQIVLVPQTVGLFSGNVADNLRIARPDASEAVLLGALEQARLREWVASQPKGLGTEVGDAGTKLSGGQRQKMGIARAFLTGAPYLIFDEATSSVDPESEREIWACIEDLAASRTIIIISHRLAAISAADRIYVLSDGAIAQWGTHGELMGQEGLYRRLVTEQAELERYGLVQ